MLQQSNIGQRVALVWGEVDMEATLTGGRTQKAEYIARGAPFLIVWFKDAFELKQDGTHEPECKHDRKTNMSKGHSCRTLLRDTL